MPDDVVAVRTALLDLHATLLAAQRIEVERFGGRMSAGEALQAAADDLRFSWLRELSTLLAALDHARSADDPAGTRTAIDDVRRLVAPPDPQTPFGRRYLRVLQDDPDAVLAHRDLVAALGENEP